MAVRVASSQPRSHVQQSGPVRWVLTPDLPLANIKEASGLIRLGRNLFAVKRQPLQS